MLFSYLFRTFNLSWLIIYLRVYATVAYESIQTLLETFYTCVYYTRHFEILLAR